MHLAVRLDGPGVCRIFALDGTPVTKIDLPYVAAMCVVHPACSIYTGMSRPLPCRIYTDLVPQSKLKCQSWCCTFLLWTFSTALFPIYRIYLRFRQPLQTRRTKTVLQ